MGNAKNFVIGVFAIRLTILSHHNFLKHNDLIRMQGVRIYILRPIDFNHKVFLRNVKVYPEQIGDICIFLPVIGFKL
jgi:hypothetical protein